MQSFRPIDADDLRDPHSRWHTEFLTILVLCLVHIHCMVFYLLLRGLFLEFQVPVMCTSCCVVLQIPLAVKESRQDELISLQQDVACEFAESLVGKVLPVLVDGYNDDGALIGRTQWDAPDVDPVVFLSPPIDSSLPLLEVGQTRMCEVSSASIYDLDAYPVG